jgi:TonB family protein
MIKGKEVFRMIGTGYNANNRHSHIHFPAAFIAILFCAALFAQDSTPSPQTTLLYDPFITRLRVNSYTGFERAITAAASKTGINEKKMKDILKDFLNSNSNRIIHPKEWRYSILDLLYKYKIPYDSAETLLRSLAFWPIDTGFLNAMRQENDREMDISSSDAIGSGPDVRMPGGNVKAPAVLDQPLPRYTDAARKVRIEGTVLLQLVVRKDGRPDQFRVLRGLGYGLDESAILTVKNKWRFKPGTYNEAPADVQILIETSFNLY